MKIREKRRQIAVQPPLTTGNSENSGNSGNRSFGETPAWSYGALLVCRRPTL